MPSTEDWVVKCAKKIQDEIWRCGEFEVVTPPTEKIDAIIATFAEPLVNLLRESKREHADGEDGRRRCNKVKYDEEEPCTCGADEWNAKVDKVLNGR